MPVPVRLQGFCKSFQIEWRWYRVGGRNVTIARAMACGLLLLLGFAVPIMADEAPGADLRLAEALAAEGQWALALAECRRALYKARNIDDFQLCWN